jgi:hypothetical protein
MELSINYENGKTTAINKTFKGEIEGKEFEIYANWNDWDDWSVDDIVYTDISSGEMSSEDYNSIESAFLDEMS